MHFLGLAGMPRRIPEYSSIFHTWNIVASIGSLISIVATVIFFVMVFDAFTRKQRSPQKVHPSVVRYDMPFLAPTKNCEDALDGLNYFLEKNHLQHLAGYIAFK